jgi:para-nitrobenzyl esterase
VQPRFTSDSLLQIHQAALAGIGIARLPLTLCGNDLEQGRLCLVAPGWAPPTISIHALYPSRRDLALAGRQFLAMLVEAMKPYSKNYPVPTQQSEDCLTVNVWAPASATGAPVIVWLHGGAWRTGATSMPLMNGQALAALGVVVVTANFRLGALGGLSHPDLVDADTGSVANWQLQDQMAALQWVHQNAAAFGGDPNNICLMGQSAGATNAAVIAQNPVYRKLLRKVVLLSPGNNAAPGGFSMNDAAAYTELLAARLNTTPRGLRDVPAPTLHAAEIALNALPLPAAITTGRNSKFIPIVDAQFCLADWTRTEWPADLPVVITTTLTEGASFVDLIAMR